MTRSTRADFEGVVVAAGSSTRFGGSLPKQFQLLGGRTVLERAVGAIAGRPEVRGVTVVLPPELAQGARADEVRGWPGVERVVAGGATRAASVLRGTEAADAAPFVLVHDAARPLAAPALVDAVIAATRREGAALPGLAVVDTVKLRGEDGRVAGTLDRRSLRRAQTPQGARRDWLLAALRRAERDGVAVTDESAALERDGRPVALVEGEAGNLKITSEQDLEEARRRVGGEGVHSSLRVGSGFDIHRRDPSRPLVLGGVRFEGEPGLVGHSDADVVLHAAMDALLGAACLDDIGHFFPPDDPRFAGASSADLAREVAARIGDAGFRVVNLDLTLLAESPKIRGRAVDMRHSIAGCLGIDASQVGLKATTLERLGALGRGEGIACQAACLLSRAPEPR